MPRGYVTPEATRLDLIKRLDAGQSYVRIEEETGTPKGTIGTMAALLVQSGRLKPRPRGRPKPGAVRVCKSP